MPSNQKDSQIREDEDDSGAPRVDELDPDVSADRAPMKLDDDDDEEVDEDQIEEIDISDLAAMEGPDA